MSILSPNSNPVQEKEKSQDLWIEVGRRPFSRMEKMSINRRGVGIGLSILARFSQSKSFRKSGKVTTHNGTHDRYLHL